MATDRKTHTVPPVKNVIAGGVGGMCLILAGQPLDTIKVNLQTQLSPALGKRPLYNSTLHCFSKIVAQEGIRGLYKGMGAPLAVITPIMSITFLAFGLGKNLQQPGPDGSLRPPQVFIAGMLAGLSSTILMAPGERIKCLLQVTSHQHIHI
ncbi:mitochondrial carnitine/acylcarnitine carrier protein-like [Xenopus laevis]|uniref:Mitochondrial carnitine/acylcarnitine carrier protein-like n=1 Tax=Xenopus laevis TaxID=8355 RepID=A0A8J1LF44_XENLA|nr:mitochondrial carnitine/acylcarnitine carrier protein-like [Xenopus laevis]